jgi:protoheme IX farnesyltransferase
MTSKSTRLKALPALLRFKLSLAVASSALTGFIYFSGRFTWDALFAFVGVFFLSGAASALNQLQERGADCLMERTKKRPLPLNLFSARQALFIAAAAGLAGLLLLFLKTTPAAAGLAVFNLFWYNCIYTPLKRRTGYAVLVGALVGALPPMIGYIAAGGYVTDKCIVICLFMYLWQISHFLLLLFKFRKEYELAGFPTVAVTMNADRFRATFFIWILGTGVSTLLFPLFHIMSGTVLVSALIIGNCLFVLYFCNAFARRNKMINSGLAFRCMYLFQGFIFALLIVESLSHAP